MRQHIRFAAALAAALFAGAESAHGQLRITEVYFNPDGNDTGTEWVEIQNVGGVVIDFAIDNARVAWARSGTETSGWTQSSSILVNAGTLAVGEYLIVGPNGAANSRPRNGNAGSSPFQFDGNFNSLRNDSGGTQNTGVGVFVGSTFSVNQQPVHSVFYGAISAGQVALKHTGVVGASQTPDFDNADDVDGGFQLRSDGSTWINAPRGGTPGFGLSEDVGGNAAFLARWNAAPTVVVAPGFAAGQGMRDDGGDDMSSDYSSLVFNHNGNLLVSIDDEGLLEVTTGGSLVRGASSQLSGVNPLVTVQGTNQGYESNEGDFEGLAFKPGTNTVFAVNERGVNTTTGATLYKMGSAGPDQFTVQESYQFTDADTFHLDAQRNFNLESIEYFRTVDAVRDQFLVAHEGNRSIYLYELDDSANTLTRLGSTFTLDMGALYNENPKDLFFDSLAEELYVMNLSGNLMQFDYDPDSATFQDLLAVYRLPSEFREFGLEGMTLDSAGVLYLAQDGGSVLAFSPVAVPEPSTWLLILSAFGAACAWRRRRTV